MILLQLSWFLKKIIVICTNFYQNWPRYFPQEQKPLYLYGGCGKEYVVRSLQCLQYDESVYDSGRPVVNLMSGVVAPKRMSYRNLGLAG